MPSIPAAGRLPGLLVACAILALSPSAVAQGVGTAAEKAAWPLYVKSKSLLNFPHPIGRVEVDREDVVAIAAPGARALRVTGVGPGDAVINVYRIDGTLMARHALHVIARPAAASAQLAADPAFAGLDATVDDAGVTLSGTASSLRARTDAARLVAAGAAPVRNDAVVSGEQVVAVDVQFAAVSSSTLKALGLNFAKMSGDLQGAVVAPGSPGTNVFGPTGVSIAGTAPIQEAFKLFLAAPNRGIGAVLSALSSNGLSELLAQPTLLVRSGEQASFLAGGEIPVPVPQGGTTGGISIEYKEFGVRLRVTPYVLSKDNIVLKIAPEVSELDYANGVQLQGYVIPGLRRRSAETTVELGSGQSYVIAGLSYSSSTLTKDKTPLLGDIPILGAFFKRQQSQKERQELIIVATPRLVSPVDAGTMPPLPTRAALLDDPGDRRPGLDGLDQQATPFGVVRR
ncbi:MAG TPA: pilus assembly protein CpaC [Sphingobium sp.]|nr:pilus assembly protein CpaC [Sphingobium sp.]